MERDRDEMGHGMGWDTGWDGYGKASRKTNFEIQAFREPRDPPAFPYILCIPGGVAAVDGGGYSGWVDGWWMRAVSNLGDDTKRANFSTPSIADVA